MHPNRTSSSQHGKSSVGPCTLQGPSLVPTLNPSHVWVQTLPASAAWRFGGASFAAGMGDLHSSLPRPLRMINPTVTFSSLSQTPCQSIFTVYRDHQQLIHQEVAAVSISPTSPSSASAGAPCWLYSTTLVPQYWSRLCDSEGTCFSFGAGTSVLVLTTRDEFVFCRTERVHDPPGSGPRARVGAVADLVRLLSLHEQRITYATAVSPVELRRRFRDRREVVPFQRVICTSSLFKPKTPGRFLNSSFPSHCSRTTTPVWTTSSM